MEMVLKEKLVLLHDHVLMFYLFLLLFLLDSWKSYALQHLGSKIDNFFSEILSAIKSRFVRFDILTNL